MEKNRVQQIIHFLKDKTSNQEQEALSSWRKAHPDHEKQFQEVKFIWEKTPLTKKLEIPLVIDTNAALKKVHQQLSKEAKIIPFRRRLIRWTVAASILLLVGFFAWNIFYSTPSQIQIVTAANETKQITLPDQSIVWLNENSSLTYAEKFNKPNRKIQLSGEAVFEVTPNPNQPFLVHSEALLVKVLGTKFSVRNQKNTTPAVYVLHGKVEVKKQEAVSEKIILTKGMAAKLDARTQKLQLNDSFSTNQLFWMTQTLHFEQTPFEEVLSTLRQVYNTQITTTNEALNSCLVRGTFKEKTAEEILATLQLIYGFEIAKKSPSNFQINKGTCN